MPVVIPVVITPVAAEGEGDTRTINRVGIVVVIGIVGVVRSAVVVETRAATVVAVTTAIIRVATVISMVVPVVVVMVVAGLGRSRSGETGEGDATKNETAENVHRMSRFSISDRGGGPFYSHKLNRIPGLGCVFYKGLSASIGTCAAKELCD